jgi:diguanylate cyclase (GGDEF)-like protein/PAS domain S-box-containing protein
VPAAGHWSAHQLAEFLSAISGHRDRAEAVRHGAERAGEALEAEVAAFVDGDSIVASAGFPPGQTPDAELVEAVEAGLTLLDLPLLGRCSVASTPIGAEGTRSLLVARQGEDGFTREEDQLLRGMARVLALTLENLTVLERERALQQRTRKIIETAQEAFISMDGEGAVTDWNGAAEATFGWSKDEVVGRPLSELILPPALRDAHRDGLRRLVETGEQRVLDRRLELTARHRLGREFPVELTITALREGSGWVFNAFLRDISDRKEAEAQLEQRASQQAAVADLGRLALEGAELSRLMKEAVRVVSDTLGIDAAELLELTPEGLDLTVRAGRNENVRLSGTDRPEVEMSLTTEAAVVVEDWVGEKRFPATRTDVASGATVVVHGRERPFGVLGAHSTERRIFSPDDLNFLQSVANVLAEAIERRTREEETRHRSLHDPLTGLPNRTLFLDRLAQALARAQRRELPVAVLFLDVDNFKSVNDTATHTSGDKLLKRLAARLRTAIRPSDTLARFGGDEFVLLCEELTGEAEAVAIAERIGAEVRRPFEIDDAEHFVTMSIGIATSSAGIESSEDLIRDADAAMYGAKERGRDRYEIFDSELRARALSRHRTERDLRGAAHRGELRLFYQPIVELRSGATRGFEALLRWEHPERGLIPPGEFIPIAENSALIVDIGGWTIREACRQAARWRAAGAASDLRYSVNLSPKQLAEPGLIPTVHAALEEAGVPPAALALEITESVLMADPDAAVETLETLKVSGVAIVLDDFGTGYSSLDYVQKLPIDELKVDRSFIARLDQEDGDPAIVSAVISMAHALDLRVVAEGVETVEQLDRLRALDCDFAQGFYFARPLPAEAAEHSLLQTDRPARTRLRAV